MDPDPARFLFEACDEVLYQDEVIIKEGDQGHEFFVIKEGEAEVLIMQKKQARIVVWIVVCMLYVISWDFMAMTPLVGDA